jgi:hypothetical protein
MSVEMNNWLFVLMVHLVRCSITIGKAAGKLTPGDVTHVFQDDNYGFIWHCSETHFKEYGKVIPFQFMMAKLEERSRINGLSPEEIEDLAHFLEHAYTHAQEDMESGEALKYLRNVLQITKVQKPLQDLLNQGADMTSLTSAMSTGVSAASIGQAEHFDPLADVENFLGKTKPDVMGTAKYFNMLVNGGLCPGEIVVLMGPMGGFKTTMAIDIVCGLAEVGKHSAFMAYEQAYKTGDLPIRFVSRMARINRDLLVGLEFDKLDEEEQEKVVKAREKSNCVRFMDRCTFMDYVSDIGANVQALIEEGMKPELVVIDQFLTWIQRWETVTEDNKRTIMQNVVLDLKRDVCEKYGTRILLLHQITAAQIAKSKSYHHTAAAECKSVGFWADFVLTIGNLDGESQVLKAITGKARRGPLQEMLVKAEAKICSFKRAEGWKEGTRSGSYIKVSDANKAPSNTMSKAKRRSEKDLM